MNEINKSLESKKSDQENDLNQERHIIDKLQTDLQESTSRFDELKRKSDTTMQKLENLEPIYKETVKKLQDLQQSHHAQQSQSDVDQHENSSPKVIKKSN